jgi:hypothetical protein
MLTSVSRQPGGDLVGAVGAVIDRWDGQTFSRAFTRSVRPVPDGTTFSAPISVVVTQDRLWVILFGDDFISIIDDSGTCLAGFGRSNGVPKSSQRLLRLADGQRVLIGGQTGLALLSRD